MTAASLVLILLLAPQQARPDPQASVLRGTIMDATTSAPLANVNVALAGLGRAAKTSADGRFEFRDLTPGTYTLTASTIGYIFVRRRVDVAFNTIVDITVPLAEGTGTYQENVTVVGDTRRPPDIGVSAQASLGSAGLQDLRGVAADDPMRAMQALPGVATGDDFQAQFSVRGSQFRHVGIVTDDITTPLLLHQVRGAGDTGSIAMINTDVIQHASLLAGPHPLKHGDWIGATLDFDLREGSRDRTATRVAVSGTSASTVFEGPLGSAKRGAWLVSVRKSYIDWLIRKLEPDIDSTIGFADLQSKIVYDLTSRQQLQFVVVAGDAKYQQVQASQANGVKDATSRSVVGTLTWRYSRPSWVLTERVSVLTSDFRDRGQRGQELSRGFTRSTIWRSDLIKPLPGNWTFEGGVRTEFEQTHEGRKVYRLVSNALQITTQTNFSMPNTTVSGWAQISRRSTSRGITAGVRSSRASEGPWVRTSPWVLGEQTFGAFTFRAGAGAASQFPEVAILAPSDPLLMRPEHTVSVDLGAEHRLTKTIRWLVTGFRRNDSNVIRAIGEDRVENGIFVHALPFPTFAARLDGTSRGVDVVLERRSAIGLTGWIGYTFAHTQYHDTSTGEQFDGDFDQRHTLNIFAQERISSVWTASAKLRVGSNFPVIGYFAGTPTSLALGSVRNAVRLPTYVRLDLRLNRTFTFNQRRLTLFAEVMNATGRQNLGQADGIISPNFSTNGFVERLIPRVPSAGILIEF